jgi:hypothetical protein
MNVTDSTIEGRLITVRLLAALEGLLNQVDDGAGSFLKAVQEARDAAAQAKTYIDHCSR